MHLAVDVQYLDKSASISGILFDNWDSSVAFRVILAEYDIFGEYESGAFFKRELPCILSLLDKIPETLTTIIIDGYVTLGNESMPGLGMHLFESIQGRTPIIGVGKTKFHGISSAHEIVRGKSTKPLYITSIGCSLQFAKEQISKMDGEFRIPTLLKLADTLARDYSKELLCKSQVSNGKNINS